MKILKYIILTLLIFISTGCISYTELSDLEIIENIIIDYQENNFIIYVNSIKKEEDIEYEITKGQGKSIEETLNSIKTRENKKLYIAHLNLLLITPSANTNKLSEILEFFLENTESRNDFLVALIENTSNLEDTNKIKDLKDKIRIIEEDLATTKTCYFEDLLKDILDKKQSYLPYIKNQEENLQVNGIILLINDKEILLTEEETILFNYMNNNIYKTNYKDNRILSNNTIIQSKDNKINIEIESILANKNDNYQENLKQDILNMFKKYQEQDIDIFNLTYLLNTKKNSNINLKDIELEINVEEKATNKKGR